MFNLIAGKEGIGKTKRLIKMANDEVAISNGNVIFIDDDKRHMYELKHDMRFISMEEFPVKTSDEFFGFLCGIISNNYDIETIYIDGLQKVMKADMKDVDDFIDKTKQIAKEYKVKFVTTMSCDETRLTEKTRNSLI
ncbi:MAG: twitching motility protein PilT [Acidaminobacteraceae bacterium]